MTGDADPIKELGLKENISVDSWGECMTSAKLSFEDLKTLWNLGIDHFNPCIAGNVNAGGMLAFYYAWKAVGIYCITAGGRSHDKIELMRAYTEDSERHGTDDGKTVADGGRVVGKYEKMVKFDEVEDGSMGTEQLYLSGDYKTAIVPVASPNTTEHYHYDTQTAMVDRGHCFPYFEGMLLPDKEYVSSIFFRYFSRCIAGSEDELTKLMPTLRRGFRALSMSPAGRILQHLFFGIQASIETGSKIRVYIERSQYLGFALVGKNALVLEQNSVKVPLSKEDLELEQKRLDNHRSYVLEIVEKLNGLALKSGGTEIVDQEVALAKPRYLANQLHRRAWKGSDHETFIQQRADKLKYGQEYWAPSEDNMLKILKHVVASTLPDDNEPYYFSNLVWDSDDYYVRLLSVFGGKAPTLSIRTGDKPILIAPSGKEDSNLVEKEGRRVLPYLPIYERSLQDAADVWKTIPRTHSLRTAGAKKGKGSGGAIFHRKDDIGILSGNKFLAGYELLRQFAYSVTASKRTRSNEDDAELMLRRAKARNDAKSAAADISSLF